MECALSKGDGGTGVMANGGMPTIRETEEVGTDISASTSSTTSTSPTATTSSICKDDTLTVEKRWKVEQEMEDADEDAKPPSKLIPIAKWIVTIVLGVIVLCLFTATKLSFIVIAHGVQNAKPVDAGDDLTSYTAHFLVVYLVISAPYYLLFIRACWMGLCTRKSPWPRKSSIFLSVLVGVMEPLGLVVLALKVLTVYSATIGILIMGSFITWSALVSAVTSRADGGYSRMTTVVGFVFMLGGIGLTGYMMNDEDKISQDIWHVGLSFICLNVAWWPSIQKRLRESGTIVTVTTDVGEGNHNSSASQSNIPTQSYQTSSSGSCVSEAGTLASSRVSQRTENCKKATWKASFIVYGVKIIATLISCFVFFYVDGGFAASDMFTEPIHDAFLEAWSFDSLEDDISHAIAVNLICGGVCYVALLVAAHANMQRGCIALPLIFSIPLTLAVTQVDTLCTSPTYCNPDNFWIHFGAGALLAVGQTLSFGYLFFRKEQVNLPKESKLFWLPGYNSAVQDSWFVLNRRTVVTDTAVPSRAPKLPKTRVFICTTMYRENEGEMKQLLESLARINLAQAEGETVFESHIVFDGGSNNKKLSEFSLVLISLLEKTLGINPALGTKVVTPYGMRLSWGLPCARNKKQMTFSIHFKDNSLVKNKKRWSQVMYMSYVLDYLIDSAAHENEEPYILTTDADVMFTPESVEALLDLMQRDKSIGGVCARTHPMGEGPLVWYQVFEYAVGHWFQKAAEHVLGSVLCAPGCFSVYRCRALKDILPKYCRKVESAFDFLTKDMGEDRWLCTLMVQSGWRIEYCAASENRTNCPAEFEEFYKQRRRWIASTLANLMLIIKEWKYVAKFNSRVSVMYLVYQGLLLFSTLLGPSTVILVVAGGLAYAWELDVIAGVLLQMACCFLFALACLFTSSKTQMILAKLYTFAYAMVMCAVAVGTAEQIVTDIPSGGNGENTTPSPNATVTTTPSPPDDNLQDNFLDIPVSVTTLYFSFLVGIFMLAGLLHPREVHCLLHGFWYLLCLPSAYLVLMIYSIANLTDSSWGTREGAILSHTVKKEPLSEKYKRFIFTIFPCCVPAPVAVRGVDVEAQTETQRNRHSSVSSTSGRGTKSDAEELQSSGDFQLQPEPQAELAEVDVEEEPIPVEEWLPREFRNKYAEIFKRHGFENTLFIKELTELEMKRMGIKKRGHLQYLSTKINMLPYFELEYKVPTNANEWLEEIGLPMYRQNFKHNSIRTPKEMEILKRFDREDIEKELGITKEGHIKRLMYAIKMLREPSDTQQKTKQVRQLIQDSPVHYLKETNVDEYEFWERVIGKCLEPDLKAFGIESEVKYKLFGVRNNWLLIVAVINTLWLILITTLATKANLVVAGANPIGLAFLFVFGLLFVIQFCAMIVHRLSTLSHYLARASYKFGKPLQTNWSFQKDTHAVEDSADHVALLEVKVGSERAARRARERSRRRSRQTEERVPLIHGEISKV